MKTFEKADPYSFLMRALLTECALDDTPRLKHYSSSLALEKAVTGKLPYAQFDDRHLLNAKRMATVFVAIASFENMMRDFINRVMTDGVDENWWNTRAPINLKKKVDARITKERQVPWHTPRGGMPINYTDFGDLADMMVSLWDHFEQDVQDQDRIKANFNVIELSRNACMHGGDLSDRDIERVGMLMRDWIEQLGIG